MSEWAMQSGSRFKKLFWPLIQQRALHLATCFHATAQSEYEDIRRVGFKQPVAVIPNGVDIPAMCQRTGNAERKLLFLGRVHPIKGLDMLLPAWAAVQQKFPDWQLQIAGPDNGGYLGQMKALSSRLGLKRVEFTGPLTGAKKLRAFADADLSVLPTYSENFGMTVAESLAAGTPVIVTKGAPWEGLLEKRAGWWIDISKDALVSCFEEALSQPRNDLDVMGHNGRVWMESEFSWEAVADKMKATYDWILAEGPQPDYVHSDH
jgi:glycosyltransferase involved in cell wall biosynthesis